MSTAQRAAVLKTLAARVRAGGTDLRRLAASAKEAQGGLESRADDVLYVAGCGALVHSWYNELEKTFEAVARRLDGFEPHGEDWNSTLAAQVMLDVPGVRPAMVSEETAGAPRELRAFRHLFRHLYVLNLAPGRVGELLALVQSTGQQLDPQLEAFAGALEAIATELERG